MATGRGKKDNKAVQTELKARVAGIVMLGTGAFLLFSLILLSGGGATADQIGPAGGFLARSLLGLFGRGSWFVPVLLIFLGITFVLGWGEKAGRRIHTAGFLLLLTGFLGLFSVETVEGLTFLTAARQGLEGSGGGVIGAVSAYGLRRVFGRVGAYILLGVLSLAGLVLLTDGFRLRLPLKFLSVPGRLLKARKRAAGARRPARPEAQPERPEELPQNLGPVISRGPGDDESYLSVKTVLMDDELGRGTGKKRPDPQTAPPAGAGPRPGAAEPEPESSGADEPMLEKQMEFCLSPECLESAAGKHWKLPPLTLLKAPQATDRREAQEEIQRTARLLEETLDSFGVKLKIDEVSCGPALTRYEARLAPGIKVSKILRLSDDLALSLAAPSIRIEAPIPGKAAIGIEVPNRVVAEVPIRQLLADRGYQDTKGSLVVVLGRDIGGEIVSADLAKMPHLLVAGATGSGKSVCMNTLICSLLYRYTPDELKILLVDPKKVELNQYNDIPHLVAPVVTDPKKAATALRWMTAEMENRYSLFAGMGVKDIYGYNRRIQEDRRDGKKRARMPYLAIFIDELADLMMVAPADVEDSICRLAQMARAAGMHLIVATQRPSVNVITGLIKANIPSRIAFAVSSQVDSRTILDGAGAEKLLGRGDMLFAPVGLNKPRRVQGAFISDREVQKVVEFLKEQGKPEYLQGIEMLDKEEDAPDEVAGGESDELLPEAAALVIETGQASISMLQRRLKVGYSRAARLIDQLEEKQVVGGYEGSKARKVLMGWDGYQSIFGNGSGDQDD